MLSGKRAGVSQPSLRRDRPEKMVRYFKLLVAALLFGVASGTSYAQPDDPFRHCQRVVTDDSPGAVPASLLPAFARAFNMSLAAVRELGSSHFRYRCYQGTVMGCSLGANLNCGKAATERRNKGADAWCRENPNDQGVPAVATGHATVYEWHCVGTRAVPGRRVSPVDDRGFETMNWQVLN
jgi:hypothetical protein